MINSHEDQKDSAGSIFLILSGIALSSVCGYVSYKANLLGTAGRLSDSVIYNKLMFFYLDIIEAGANLFGITDIRTIAGYASNGLWLGAFIGLLIFGWGIRRVITSRRR